jgi:small-conductance mechanosensitive channel
MTDNLQHAIEAIRSGDKETGQRLLAEVIRNDPRNEAAWLWMSSVIDSDQHRRDCLEKVLAINPHNETAQRGLEALKQPKPADALPPGQDEAYWKRKRERFEEVSRKLPDEKKKSNPILSALALICLIAVVFLFIFGWNQPMNIIGPLIAFFAVIGLVFAIFSRR